MKNTVKKLLAILIAATFAMTFFAIGASAEDDYDYYEEDYVIAETFIDHIYYLLDEEAKEALVYAYEINDEGYPLIDSNLVIPETVEYESKDYTVTTISDYAFADCDSIEAITLPSTIKYLGSSAFSGTDNLKKITIPDDCYFDYFGYEVFTYSPVAAYLEEQAVDGEVILGENVLYSYLGNAKTYTLPDSINIIADHAFFMSDVEKVVLNDNISEISDYTFASCANLKKINIPDSVTYIGTGAFSYCSSLTELKLTDTVEILGYKVFEGTPIKEVYIGASMFDVVGSFTGCKTLEKIAVSPENEKYFMVGDGLYYDYGGTDEYGFYYADYSIEYYLVTSDETEPTLAEHMSYISDYAFADCTQLKSVTFMSDSIAVGYSAFANCKNLESLDFSCVIDIYDEAFTNCTKLTSADLSNVSYIGDSAFENCTKLSSVTFGDSIYSISGRAFAGTALETVSIGGDGTWIREGAFMNCDKLTRVDFNEGVDYIGAYIFTGCDNLERVSLADSITYIEEGAFEYCDDTVFEVIKYSYAYDYIKDAGLNYEIVGKVPFFTRVQRFFMEIFEFLFGWMMLTY